MQLITNEYTVLYNQGEGEDVKIFPNIPFEPIEGNFRVSSYALIKENKEKGKVVQIIKPGQLVKRIGQPKEPLPLELETSHNDATLADLTNQDLREILIDNGISFKKTATKAELIKAINA